MKKRILALALAATTAFSMFGASLSASAIDAWTAADVPAPETEKLTVTYTAAVEGVSDAEAIFKYGGKEIDVTDFVLAGTYDDAISVEVEKGVAYLYNYVDDDKVSWGTVETAYENGDAVALAKALGAVEGDKDKEIALKNTEGTYRTFRTALEKKFEAFKKGAQTVVETNSVKDDYKLNDLVKAAKELNVDNTASSVLVYYMQAYEVYAEYSELPTIDDAVVDAQAKLDSLAERTEEDFKVAKDYKYFVADLETLQDELDAAKTTADVAAVVGKINTLAIAYPASGADKADLKALLLSLFDGKTINQIKAIAEYPTDGAKSNAVFDAADYNVKSDAWKAFAAAYADAVKVYKLVASKSYPTDVAKATDILADAIDGLSVSNGAPNWLLVKIEEGLAAVSALDSADYTKANWATIEAAIAKAEAVLDAAKPGYSAALAADKALTDAQDLPFAAPTASEKKALAAAITAGQKALKALDKEADGAQYYALTIAINNANALYKDGVLKDTVKKSDIANAIDAINDAIDFSGIVLGWNKLADGSYMYGTADGYVTSAWKWIGSSWYYFDAKGIMATGWQQLDGAWYYFYTWGGMAKGWAQVNGTWYYLNPNGGKMLSNGWNWIDGKCYYFYSWGGMAANTTIDGYKVDASGAWVK